ncbi:hypothetical protein ScPMuIL_000098 [Solemya velum]
MEFGPSPTPQYRPVVDHYLLPDVPEVIVDSGRLNAESFLTGATQNEGARAADSVIKNYRVGNRATRKLLTLLNCIRGDLPEVVGIIDSILEQYLELPFDVGDAKTKERFSEIVGDYFITAPTHHMAEQVSRHNVSVYVYNFEYKSKHDSWKGVLHGDEILYLSGFPLTGHKHFKFEKTDKTMARLLLQAWSNFIIYGLPSLVPSENFQFPSYAPHRRAFTRIAKRNGEPSFIVSSDFKSRKLDFWNNRVPEMFREQSERHVGERVKTSYITYTKTPNAWALIAACIGLSVLTGILTLGYCRTRQQIRLLLARNTAYDDKIM